MKSDMELKLGKIPSQKGRIAIVTGANNGIGYEITVGLAKVGYKVILACRNIEKASSARNKIMQSIPEADLDILQLDLSDLYSVREFVNRYSESYQKLDVLVNNAGVMTYSEQKNAAGIELQFATNHLGHFALTSLLINHMPNDERSRIVSLSSVAHKSATIHFDDIECKNAKGYGAAYGQSKLACLMFGDELNRRLNKSDCKIRSLSVHPGVSDTGLFDEMSWIQSFLFKVLGSFMTHSSDKAAVPALYAALSSDVVGGDFYGPTGMGGLKGKLGVSKRSEYSKDMQVAEKLWDLSEELSGIEFTL
ncbi:SDR family NAD(P)-dependent oxidoreductase [Labilibacter sediminis]|nr:SDR family NAD(P)-dependent oxidoreductase [Labilibacter sediminis]